MTGYLSTTPCMDAPLRLFCFHHAGGAASAFADWPAQLEPDVSVVPVQLPGRETRVGEPRLLDMAELVSELSAHLEPWLDAPCAFYGHSMGAFVAHALVRRRAGDGLRLPECLLVGAAKAPQLPMVLREASELDDQQLGRLLVGFGGMSEMLLRYPDWLRAATELVRDDLRICASNPYREPLPMPVPLELFAGRDDTIVGVGEVAEWKRHTSVDSRLHVVPGGHFFFRDHPDSFLARLSSALGTHTPSSTAPRT
jgi:surfactin synthase thioesterase subunit